MTDDLESRLRAADPATVKRDDPISKRGQKLLTELKASDGRAAATPIRSPRRRTLMPLYGAAAAAALVVGVVIAVGGGSDDYLQPPLITASVDEDAQTAMTGLADLAAVGAGTGVGADGDTVRVAYWTLAHGGEIAATYTESADSLESSVDDDSMTTMDAPAEESAEESGDDSGDRFDGSIELNSSSGADDSGEPEWVEYAPGASDLPVDVNAVGPYLSNILWMDDPSVVDYLFATRILLTEYVLTAEQESALLEFLAEQDGLDVMGRTTDRGGREAMVFRGSDGTDDAPAEYEYLLLVSTTTGAILGMETVYVGPEQEGLRSPSVVDFTIWER